MGKEHKEWTVEYNTEYPGKMGAVKEKDGIRFTVIVPQGKKASLLLYLAGSEEIETEIPFPDKPVLGNIHSMKVLDLPWQKYEYNYKMDEDIQLDPYAALIIGREKFGEKNENQARCGFSFKKFNWEEDSNPCIPYEDAVMYHLHVRNFTMNKKSGVRHKGTFRGLEEKIPYLKDLGVNQVKLMPVYEFDEFPRAKKIKSAYVEELVNDSKMNCWGYGEGNYYAPKRSYAASKDAEQELKHMIKAFHQQQMEVILDFYFIPETPIRLILDCLLYWVQEYHIDGFHIMGAEEAARILANDPAFSKTKIICSYFQGNSISGKENQNRNCAELNDGFLTDMRRILKGDEGVLEQMAYRTRRNPVNAAVINYITNHDGFTLRDLVSFDEKHNEENGERNADGSAYNFSWNCGAEGDTRKKQIMELRKQQMKNAVLLMMLSQGVPMLMAGDEIGNSQGGNNNPYCLDNDTSWVSWNRLGSGKEFIEFVKKAILFRKNHPVLHMPTEMKMNDYRACGYPDLSYHSDRAWYGGFEYNSRQLGMLYCGQYSGTEEFLYAAYNLHPLPQTLALPKLPDKMKWYIEIDTSLEKSFPDPQELELTDKKMISVSARSIIVLIGKEA